MAQEALNAAGHSLHKDPLRTHCFFTPGERPAMTPVRAAQRKLLAAGMMDFPGEIIFA
jgi:hypothetical protein